MKRFLKYVSIFIFPILLLASSAEILLRNIPNDYSFKKKYLDRNSQSIETLFLGSSHVFYGIDPRLMQSPSFNASYVSQTLNYDFEILKKYDKKWNNLKCIVLPVDYFSFYSKLETAQESWRVKNYNIYYKIHTSREITDNSEILSGKLKINMNRIRSFYFSNISNITCSELGAGERLDAGGKNLLISGEQAAKRHHAKSKQYFQENIEILKSIIQYAEARNIKVLLFTCPAYKTYVQNLDRVQLNCTVNTAKKIAGAYKNVAYFNFLEDNAFHEGDFYDADHLNEMGARKLTFKMDSLLKSTEKDMNIRP